MNVAKLAVSIIVTSYTMERFNDLIGLLDSIQAQSYHDFETIAVVERSTELRDKLKAYIEEKGYPNTRVLFSHGAWGLSQARNLGIKEAKGDIIAFIDDDALAFPDWLEEIVKAFSGDDSVISVTGSAFPSWENESMEWFPEEFYWIISCTGWFEGDRKREVRNAWGANMAFRKEAFSQDRIFGYSFGSIGGGKEGNLGLTSDDTEFSLRLRKETGKRIMYVPGIRIWHRAYAFRLKPKYIRRLAYRHGYTKAVLRRYYGDSKGEDVLTVEYGLLRRIMLRLLPRILVGFFTEPVISWKRMSVTSRVLFYTGLGYLMATLRRGEDTLRTSSI